MEEFLTGDCDLPICNDDDWQTVFFVELAGSHTSQKGEGETETTEENDEDESDADYDEVPKIKTYKEAITALEQVSQFYNLRTTERNCWR